LRVARSAGVLALALLGDALLYVALPVDAALFGVSAGSVGLLLSANRLVRIVSYGAIARLADRLGPRGLTLLEAAAATVSTLGYGLVRGVLPLLLLRLVWGLAFGALSLTTVVYATEEPARAGARMGASRAWTAMGPLLALTSGPLLAARWGSPAAFLVLGSLTALAVPLAASLPRTIEGAAGRPRAAPRERWGFLARRSFLTWWSFCIGFVADGVFAVSFALLAAGLVPARTALALTGLVLATRYVAEILLAPVAGRLGDRVGAMRLLRACTVVVAAGFLMMAFGAPGWVWPGAATVVIARGLLLPLGPAALAAAMRGPRDAPGGASVAFRAQGDLAAWRDLGAALGPLAAGWAAPAVPVAILYAGLASMVLVVLATGRPRRRRLRPFPADPVSLSGGAAGPTGPAAPITLDAGVEDARWIPSVIPFAHHHRRADRAHAGGRAPALRDAGQRERARPG
jgi:MFS family permease